MPTRDDSSDRCPVVGAGVIGLGVRVAGGAARRCRCAVIDRETPGSGASRVAAGMLAPVGEASWGEQALLELNLASARAYPGFAAELEDGLRAGRRLPALRRAPRRARPRRGGGASAPARAAALARPRGRVAAPGELPASSSPGCRRPVPRACTRPTRARSIPAPLIAALVAATEGAGGEVLPGTEATDALIEGDRLRGVRTADGRELRADQVVLAAGCWSGSVPWLPPDARPAGAPGQGPDPAAARARRGAGVRADRRHAMGVRRPARRRPGRRRGDGRGARLRAHRDRGRRPRVAARGVPGRCRRSPSWS